MATFVSGCALFHKKPAPIQKVVIVDPLKKTADSLKKAKALKPYGEIITKNTISQKGFFTVHKKDNKYFFEVPNVILGREILVVSRIAKASADMRNGNSGYAGDQIGETVYSFAKGPDNKLFLRRMSYSEYAKDSSMTLFAAVAKNNVTAIAASFPILTMPKDSSAVVVEVTDFLNSDNDILYFQKAAFKTKAGMGGQMADRSYIDYIHTYPKNVEIRAVKTYAAGLNPTGSVYTVELNASMVLLDLKPMKARLQDPRVGYFSTSFKDFAADPQGVETTTYVKRWKLEPKPEDVERYKRGELVEPAKQIVFYIDPVTPKKWVPYLIAGVNDWQKAFESAGFKNAVIAKEAPTKEQDSTWSIDDANHSAIVYLPSAVANAMGPSIADPRSGEIIESHIYWYHNVMSLLHRWYMIQAGAVDPRARKQEFDDQLMGDLIRFVSSHEVGHTLGLLHNFGSSSTVPVEKLRDKAWVEASGHTPSIMDYARFNYVAQPEDHISEKGIYPRIGDYDKWAIKWGYTWYPEYSTAEAESKMLVNVVTDSLKKNRRLWFGSEAEPNDPRSQNEDLGDNAMTAGTYGIKNLKRIVPQIENWVSTPGEGQEKLFKAYEGVWDQFTLYLGHVTKNIAGSYHTFRVNGEAGLTEQTTPYLKQKSAVKFLNDQLFATPVWLNNKSITNKLGVNFGYELNALQQNSIDAVITRARLSRLMSNEQNDNGKKYTINELFSDLDKGIFKEVIAGQNVDYYRRNMQKLYLYRLLVQGFYANDMTQVGGNNTFRFTVTDLNGLIRNELTVQKNLFKKALKNASLNKVTRIHLKEMIGLIDSKFAAEKSGLVK
ncbi:zinc-dependent metalloprotease [Pedobacter sp. MC2016-14]|uniref:zinc-dependent metalloprotease n=1 Tax=Pedobacter sp. MC2016-14 TaxID=2897327 RepID=UPI001E44044F|nr:zinc-dependent metalloprotease [Pedobacter sp. MC2016-14]MCD0488362.1 zinc-dependent metalloprotease [Pedobacter sp. MC2016-14]